MFQPVLERELMATIRNRTQDKNVFRAILLLMVLVAFTAAGTFVLPFAWVSTPRCDPTCDYGLLEFAIQGYLVFAFVLAAAACVGVILLRNRGRTVIIPPLIALGLMIGGTVVAGILANLALQP